MKTIVLGDIHGRRWWRDIIEQEKPDRVVFLGDYVSSHDGISDEEQISNLQDILKFKENTHDMEVILLRGNHDVQHMACEIYVTQFSRYVYEWFQSNMDWFMENTQWIYHIPKTKFLCSHAGITKKWMNRINVKSIKEINGITDTLSPFVFYDQSYSGWGNDPLQGCTWVRPEAFIGNKIDGYTQIVGHTTFPKIINEENAWFIDTQLKEYLVIEDDVVSTKKSPID